MRLEHGARRGMEARITLVDIPYRGMAVLVDEAPRFLLRSDPKDHGLGLPEFACLVCLWIALALQGRNWIALALQALITP